MDKKLLSVIFIITTSILLLIACGSPQSEEASTPDAVPTEFVGLVNPLRPDAAVAGASVFQANCEICHGPQGHGDGVAGESLDPRPKNLADLQTSVGDDYLFWRIHDGKPGTSMVAWKGILTDEEIWQVVAFIRTLR